MDWFDDVILTAKSETLLAVAQSGSVSGGATQLQWLDAWLSPHLRLAPRDGSSYQDDVRISVGGGGVVYMGRLRDFPQSEYIKIHKSDLSQSTQNAREIVKEMANGLKSTLDSVLPPSIPPLQVHQAVEYLFRKYREQYT